MSKTPKSNQLFTKLLSPHKLGTPGEVAHFNIISFLLITTLAASAVLFIHQLFIAAPVIFPLLTGALILLVLLAIYLVRSGKFRNASTLYLLSFWFFLTATIFYIDLSAFSQTVAVYVLIIFMGGILLGSRFSIAIAGLSILSLAVFAYLSTGNSTTPPRGEFTSSWWFPLYAIVIFISFWVASVITSYIRETVGQSKEDQKKLKESNQELQDIKLSLERKVKEQVGNILYQKQYFQALVDNSPIAIVTLDMAHKILDINHAFEKLFAYDREKVLGHNLDDLITNQETYAEATGYTQKVLGGDTLHRVGQRCTKDGNLIDVEIFGVPVFVDNKKVGALALYHDITEQLKTENALRSSEQKFRDIFEKVSDFLYVHDIHGKFIETNLSFSDAFDYTEKELEELSIVDLVPDKFKPQVADYLKEVQQKGKAEGLMRVLAKDRSERIIEYKSTLVSNDGKTSLIHGSARDITERKRASDALKESEQRYQSLFDGVPIGLYRTTIDGKILDANLALVKMLKFPDRETLLRANSIDLHVNPQDRHTLQKLFEKNNVVKNFEIQLRCYDGSTLWVSDSTSIVTEDDDHGIHYQGRLEDITDRKQAQEALQLTSQVFDNTLEGIIITDPDTKTIRINDAYTTITGYTSDEIIGKTPYLFASDLHDKEFYTNLWNSLHAQGKWQGEIWNRRKNGEVYPQWSSISAVKNEEGEVINYVCVGTDYSSRKELETRLEYLATHDPLTNLPNRTLFYDRLNHAISLATRNASGLAVLFLDLDDFKEVNDQFGHIQGDKLLKTVAERLNSCLRETDTVARLGGDEFTFILENINSTEEAAVVAGKIFDSLAEPIIMKDEKIIIGTSLGISLFPEDGSDTETLLEKADSAMYKAKQKGKDNYQFF